MRLGRDEVESSQGLAAAEWAVTAAATMGFLLVVANLALVQYGEAAVRSATEAGARAAVAVGGSEAECEAAAYNTLRGSGGLLRGDAGQTAVVACTISGGAVDVHVASDIDWLVGGGRSAHVEHQLRRQVEVLP